MFIIISFPLSLQLVYLVFTTPLLYDFYNYSPKDSEFDPLLNEFLQVCLNSHVKCFSSLSVHSTCGNLVYLLCLLAECCTFWCIAFLYWDEELNSEEATEKEGPKGKNNLDIPGRQWFMIDCSFRCYKILGISTQC